MCFLEIHMSINEGYDDILLNNKIHTQTYTFCFILYQPPAIKPRFIQPLHTL